MARGSSPQKIGRWTKRLKRFEQSGFSVARFCQAEGVSQASFYRWKKKLEHANHSKGRSAKTARQDFVAVDVSLSAASLPVTATIIRLGHGVEIELGSDVRVVESIVKQLLELPSRSVPLSGGRSC